MYNLECITKKELYKLEGLWVKLNDIHLADSRYFKDRYKSFTFQERIKKFLNTSDQNIRIECIVDKDKSIKGYCISTIENSLGEVESLYIEDEVRGSGYGKLLINQSIEWMNKRQCERIVVSVADGHESVLKFYESIGFRPKLTVLELSDAPT